MAITLSQLHHAVPLLYENFSVTNTALALLEGQGPCSFAAAFQVDFYRLPVKYLYPHFHSEVALLAYRNESLTGDNYNTYLQKKDIEGVKRDSKQSTTLFQYE